MDYKAKRTALQTEAQQLQQRINQMAARINAIGGQLQLLDEIERPETPKKK